jgi:hypothetical protein
MLTFPEYWLKRRRLMAQLKRGYKADDKAVAKARAAKASAQDIHDLKYEQAQENWLLEDELQQLESRYLCLQANKHRVPIPPHSDKELWEESNNISGWQLTAKGFASLRADLRKEKNERWQWWELRIKVLVALATALTGLVGAIIGWIALAKH